MVSHSTTRFVFIRQAALAALVVLSFLTAIVPLGAAAAPDMPTMTCCMGASSGHCSSGLMTRAKAQPEPDPDPMCGMESPSSQDHITIVVTPAADKEEPHHNNEAESTRSRATAGESSIPTQIVARARLAQSDDRSHVG